MEALSPSPPIEYGIASRAIAGERHNGDAAFVQALADGALIAVVDGLGHGEEAAFAASSAIEVLRKYADEPLLMLFDRCHEALQRTRGVAMTLVRLDPARSMLDWAGVGNVEAVLIAAARRAPRRDLWLVNAGGVVGYKLPSLQARTARLFDGDLLILATDGIDDRFAAGEIDTRATPDDLAHNILDQHGKSTDDALVLVLRWQGRNLEAARSGGN